MIVSDEEATERARLIDFGLAYATGDGWEPQSPDLTEDGHAPGTPIYMSPQQAVHERPVPAFDIYSFGAMLYELFSGNPPHEGVPLGELLARKCDPESRPFPIGKICHDLPDRLADLVDRCLAYAPGARPTAEDVLRALEAPEAEVPAPELQLVPPLQPSIIADGARPAGDVTRADLERKAVPLPFVKRAEQGRREQPDSASGWAEADEARVVPKAAMAAFARQPAAVTAPATRVPEPTPTVEPTPTQAPRRSGLPWLLLPMILIALGVAGFFLIPRERTGTHEPAPASVDARPTPQPGPTDEQPAGDAKKEEPKRPIEPAVAAAEAEDAEPPTEDTKGADTEAELKPPKPKRPTQRSKPRSSPTPKSDVSCEDRRARADEARAARKWSAVLTHTKNQSCWAGQARDRRRLRVEALMRLGRFKACAAEAQRSSDPKVSKWGEDCFRHAALGSSAGEGAP